MPQRPQEKNNGNQGKNETKFRRICGGHTPIRVISLSKSWLEEKDWGVLLNMAPIPSVNLGYSHMKIKMNKRIENYWAKDILNRIY